MTILMHFKIQLMYFQKLFTEFKNLDLLLSYNPSKLGLIHSFFPRRSGNFGRKLRFSHFEILLFCLRLTLGIRFLAKLSNSIGPTNVIWDFS